MKEIDFLPEWYKEDQRRQVHRRRQYGVLVLIFLAMMAYNVTVTQKTSRATAELARFEEERIHAENAMDKFDVITRALNEVQAKANLINALDSKIDVAALLAEMSHLIGETVVLSRIEGIAEPLPSAAQGPNAGDPGVRPAEHAGRSSKRESAGGVRFKLIRAGVAASPLDVAALLCRLDDSIYFRQVYPSFSRNSKVSVPASKTKPGSSAQNGNSGAAKTEKLDTSEFEITCYLANYEEVEG
jgi:hypothetical protein